MSKERRDPGRNSTRSGGDSSKPWHPETAAQVPGPRKGESSIWRLEHLSRMGDYLGAAFSPDWSKIVRFGRAEMENRG